MILVATTKGVSCNFDGTSLDDQNDLSPDPQASAAAQAASAWQELLFAAAPGQFEPTMERPGYRLLSLIGVASGTPHGMHGFEEPLVLDGCSSSVEPGLGYQWLSNTRYGWRAPICGSDHLTQLAVASSLVQPKSPLCSMAVPAPTEQHPWDLEGMTVTFDGRPLERVADEHACGERKDAYVLEGTSLEYCPYTCDHMNGFSEGPTVTLCE